MDDFQPASQRLQTVSGFTEANPSPCTLLLLHVEPTLEGRFALALQAFEETIQLHLL